MSRRFRQTQEILVVPVWQQVPRLPSDRIRWDFALEKKNYDVPGMDYWDQLDVTRYADYEEFLEKNPGAKIYMATTKGPRAYTEVHFEPDCYLMFGKESAGIPEEILHDNKETSMRIPMLPGTRSLNLSNSVAIVVYEALRQNGFSNMELTGHLRNYDWD